nr:SpaA isopeptide-forming pilin-related protein [Granulicatella sp. 19428wC4_WM01]
MVWESLNSKLKNLTSPTREVSLEEYQTFKNDVLNKVNVYKDITSWSNSAHTIKVGESITLTDEYNVVQNLVIPSEINGFTTSVNGNQLTITATKQAEGGKLFFRQDKNNRFYGTSLIYRSPGSQTVANLRLGDPQYGSVNLNVIKNGNIKIVKTDSETGQPLSDVEFGVFEQGSDTPLKTGITDGNGVLEFTDLDSKTFDIKELRTKETYRLNDKVYSVSVPAGETVTVNATNVVKKMRISVSKHLDTALDGSGTRAAGSGITFDIVSLNTHQVVSRMVTDANGYAISEELRQDDRYQLVEHTPEGYQSTEPITVEPTGEDGKIYHYIVENNAKKSYVQIVKVDEDTGETIKASGVSFQLFKDGQLVSQQVTYPSMQTINTFTTDENGQVTLPQQLTYGTYTLKEVKAPTGYVLSDKPLTIDITGEDTLVTVRFKNAAQKGVITLSKTGQVLTSWQTDANGVHTPVYQDQLIGGATFQLTNVNTGKSFTVTTQAGQVLRTPELDLGEYDVVEVSAPKGYMTDNTVYRVSLTPQAQSVRLDVKSLSVYNERKTLSIPVQKIFEQSEQFTHDQSATIGLYTKEAYHENGVVLPAHTLVGLQSVTGHDTVIFNHIPSEMSVYAKEISSSEAYTVNEQAFEVSVSSQDAAMAQTIVIENTLKRGSQELVKVDASSKEVIAGATFRLVAVLDDYTEKEVGTYTTDNNGKIVFKDLEYGHYFTQEVATLPGYLLNPTPFFFEVIGKEAQNVKPIEVANEPIPAIVTEATSETGGKVVYTHEQIKEVAHFSHLVIGQEYEAVANMFTGGGQLLGTQKRTFIATDTTHQEVFYFDVPVGHYGDTVFGEELYRKGERVAVHFDLANKKQTVKVLEPKINTFAKIGGTKDMTVGEHKELVDTLTYTDFKNGKVLVSTWVVKYGTDEIIGEKVEQVLELDGNGEVSVRLDKIDTSKLPAGKYTIMEQVFDVSEHNGKVEKGHLISEHVDNTDENQSFTVSQPVLPYTGSENSVLFTWIGFVSVLGGAWILRRKQNA